MTTGNSRWCVGNECKPAAQQFYCESVDPVGDPDGPCNAMSDQAPKKKGSPDSAEDE